MVTFSEQVVLSAWEQREDAYEIVKKAWLSRKDRVLLLVDLFDSM